MVCKKRFILKGRRNLERNLFVNLARNYMVLRVYLRYSTQQKVKIKQNTTIGTSRPHDTGTAWKRASGSQPIPPDSFTPKLT